MAACCAILEAAQASITFNGASFPICYGPDFTVRAENERLYGRPGLEAVRDALRPGGIAAFWSAEVSDPFEARLTGQGWDWQREDVQLAGGRADAFHHVYFGRDRMAQVLLPTHGGWALAHTIR